jgi:hypothetical protein
MAYRIAIADYPGTDIIYLNGETDAQLWRWESGMPLSTNATTTSKANVTEAGND